MESVLVVEQDPHLTRLICASLTDAGLEANVAHSLDGAFREVDRTHPVVIVLDVDPDDANPRRYAERMHELSPESHVVSFDGDVEVGADAYVRRPIDAEALVREVERLASS